MSRTLTHQALTEGYALHWYVIESVLGQGGFGITYLGRDTNLDQLVAIKEFLPTELATRSEDSRVHPISADDSGTYEWGLDRFLAEARTLAQFKHPNIVQVYTVFEANNTAYMVMEYERGRSLADALRFRHIEGEDQLLTIIDPVLDGLEKVHAHGFIHRDIKPDNIYVREDGSPVLLDFGSARRTAGAGTGSLTALVSPGFAPFEQYDSSRDGEHSQGPWTDIYALAATMYLAIAGKGPPDAIARANAAMASGDTLVPAIEVGAGRYSRALLEAIDCALALHGSERPQSVGAWRAMLRGDQFSDAETTLAPGAESPRSAPTVPPPVRAPEPGPARAAERAPSAAPRARAELAEPAAEAPAPRRLALVATLAAVLIVGAGGAAWWAIGTRDTGDPAPSVSAAPAPMPAPPPAQAPAQAPVPSSAAAVVATTASLEAGNKALAQMRLLSPPGDNALEYFRAALAADPGNLDAMAGLRATAEQLISIAERAMRRDDRNMAREYLDKAARVLPEAAEVHEARARLLGEGIAAYRPELPAGLDLASSVARPPAVAGAVLRDCDACPALVAISPGTFTMGDDGEAGLPSFTAPAHAVAIGSGFALGQHEVTFAEWDACVADGGCGHSPDDAGWGRGSRPVIDVSFDHAREFLRWLSTKAGKQYRLPTEAEWEYVARGGAGLAYPWGDSPASGHANCWDCAAEGPVERTTPVGSFSGNALGVRDLGGNVWEWVEDCWNASFDGAPADGSAWLNGNCRLRGIRGGSWMNDMSALRTANRGKQAVTVKRNFVGFRVARDM